MHQHRQVPKLGQQRQRFEPRVLGQMPMAGAPESPITDSVQELGLEIYARLASQYIAEDYEAGVLPHQLRELAKSSQEAALAYYEELGVKFDK